MRRTMNISVTDEMHRFILARTRAGRHSSVSEYIRSLVRGDGHDPLDLSPGPPNPPRRANDYFTAAAAVRRLWAGTVGTRN